MRFDSPAPTAPQWLAFLGSYVVPKDYMEKTGVDGFRDKPIGSGPYRHRRIPAQCAHRARAQRRLLGAEAEDAARHLRDHQGPVGARRRDPIRTRSISPISVPVREVQRLKSEPNLAGELNPITRVILLQVRNDLGFADENVRLAAHHAIDKKALSQAFYGGAAVPLSVPATPGTAAYLDDYHFSYDPELAKQLLAKSGYSAEKPAKFTFASTNGNFPSDYDIARALVQMWKKVGIEVDLEVIEYAKYFELNRGAKLPEATLYSFDNATGDPEIFAGYLLNPKLPFSAWKGMEIGQRAIDLFNVANYDERVAGYKALNKDAVESGASHPAPAERANPAAQEEPLLHPIRERLGARRHHGLGMSSTRRANSCSAHSREGGNPDLSRKRKEAWIPAFAGMSGGFLPWLN